MNAILKMRLSSFLFVLFILFCCSNSLVVRMSDRKPKWAVNKPQTKSEPPETKPQVQQEEQPKIEPQAPEEPQPPQNEKTQNSSFDIQSVQKKRSPLEFNGMFLYRIFMERPFFSTSFIIHVCGL